MQQVNWDRLQPYSGDNKKSFEELCYQIVSEKFNNEVEGGATLTSIDDSGGGDGVEFYLTFPNGDVYGWQSKFFCRLEKGGRKEQIKQSLQIAFKKHPTLKKWFLCTKCNFTVEEKTWFETKLSTSKKNGERVLPVKNKVELIHMGESEFLYNLNKFPSILKFFFSEKLLTQEWFNNRYTIDIGKSQIKAKYESEIHIPTNVDDAINKILGGERLAEILEREIENGQVKMYVEEFEISHAKLYSKNVDDSFKDIQARFREFLQDKSEIITTGFHQLNEIKKILLLKDERLLKSKIKKFEEYIHFLWDIYKDYEKIKDSKLCEPINILQNDYKEVLTIQDVNIEKSILNSFVTKIKKVFTKKQLQEPQYRKSKKESAEIQKENRIKKEAREILYAPLYSLKEYAISSLDQCLEVFDYLEQNELHISGKAGMGKTHISFNIYEDQVKNQKQPAIFIFAKDICTNQNLESQLKEYLGIPTDWTFDEFLETLEVAARTYKTKIPIIIDGMNESTYWSSIWKTGLENLLLKIKQNCPHIVFITTYRTSYEDQLFPNNYFDYKTNKDWWKRKVHVRGFEGLTMEAIRTYFDYYKIKLSNYSNAIDYFKHPLHLKIFCITKNPTRQAEVQVSFQNEDLFEVFDEYIKKSNLNITTALAELDSKYDNDYTVKKLLKLSEYIWTKNSRGIPRSENLFSNDELRIFQGENLLIFQDWNKENNYEEIHFTYDLLGGYFVAKYLINAYKDSYPLLKIDADHYLTKFSKIGMEFLIPKSAIKLFEKSMAKANNKFGRRNSLLKFAKSREFRKKLLNKNTQHPLFNDILRTISILLIKNENIFLFNILKNERAKKYSTESVFEINAKYVKKNEDVIKNFLKTVFLARGKKYLLGLAENIELDEDHPLNFDFWSDLLISLSITDRDLSWGIYVKNRSRHGNSHFSKFVNNFENVCKNKKKLSNRIHFAAKKVMWISTTTIRKLRDETTSALYYYARKYPKEFLKLLKYSLEINDPYVSERMLAVSYGLAMARQHDLVDDSYCKEWLPKYGRFLFENIFSENGKYKTTHILARDYAKRTIDISLLHYPKLLTESEKDMVKYPLKSYPQQDWGESEDKDQNSYRDGNAPIQMDFENYTIGGLIKERNNYDSTHVEFKKVLSQIFWRIYELGYSLEKFSKIDKQIAKDYWNYSSHEDVGKIDRYGKKYSWIAFYEMVGHRSDLGLLKGWEDEDEFRIPDLDIDPSFPVEVKQYDLLNELGNDNFIGDLGKPATAWYDNNNDLDIYNYICIKNKFNEDLEHDWILLKGVINQKDRDDQTRDVHIAVNAVLVDEKDFKKLNLITKKQTDYTFGYIRNVEDYYLYEGEIPWCDLMPGSYSNNFMLFYNYHDVKKKKRELQILNNGEKLSKEETSYLREKLGEYLNDKLKEATKGEFEINTPFSFRNQDDELTKKVAEKCGYVATFNDVFYTEKENDSLELDIETTIFDNSWESHHSEIIPNGQTETPSKLICDELELFIKPQSSDIYNKDGDLVSTSFKDRKNYNSTSTFTYIRKDYFENYIQKRNKKIIWIQWAEKRYFPNGIKKLQHANEREKTEYRIHHKIIL